MIDTGEMMKACRKFRKMSQAELVRASGTPKQTVSCVEKTKSCNVATFVRLLNSMGFDIEIIPIEEWEK